MFQNYIFLKMTKQLFLTCLVVLTVLFNTYSAQMNNGYRSCGCPNLPSVDYRNIRAVSSLQKSNSNKRLCKRYNRTLYKGVLIVHTYQFVCKSIFGFMTDRGKQLSLIRVCLKAWKWIQV